MTGNGTTHDTELASLEDQSDNDWVPAGPADPARHDQIRATVTVPEAYHAFSGEVPSLVTLAATLGIAALLTDELDGDDG